MESADHTAMFKMGTVSLRLYGVSIPRVSPIIFPIFPSVGTDTSQKGVHRCDRVHCDHDNQRALSASDSKKQTRRKHEDVKHQAVSSKRGGGYAVKLLHVLAACKTITVQSRKHSRNISHAQTVPRFVCEQLRLLLLLPWHTLYEI